MKSPIRLLLPFFSPVLFCAVVQAQSVPAPANGIDKRLREKITSLFARQALVKSIYSTVLSPDGQWIAWSGDDQQGIGIWIAPVADPSQAKRITANGNQETDPAWSPDGRRIAFFSDAPGQGQPQVFVADVAGGNTGPALTSLAGYVSRLAWAPDGSAVSLLYVANATREPSPMAAENRATGIIDSLLNRNVQRLVTVQVATGRMQPVSPPGLYVFEYDWRPDARGFAYIAAPPPGDDNWYIARLYKQALDGDSIRLYTPRWQIANLRYAPDGKQIAFIEGLMSDQGGVGGEVYTVPDQGGAVRNLTPGRKSTPAWLAWRSREHLLVSEFSNGWANVFDLALTGAEKRVWRGEVFLNAGPEVFSVSAAGNRIAFIASDFNRLPAVYAGTQEKLKKITRVNDSVPAPAVRAQNISWKNEGQSMQGWLLFPEPYDSTKKYPMLVAVHGGPAWLSMPGWIYADFNTTFYPQFGYFVFCPNPRGSYGQGEAFTQANRGDWGFGDLSDILAGVDEIAAAFPVDTARLGILGWSYGGSMAMIASVRSQRFKAAVAGAGSCDWLSYYGQNRIDQWMKSYFPASPYEDPLPYQRVSAMNYIRHAKTPTLILVGERDGESPSPQSFQYWHALKELGVPTQLVVYPDEGHSFEKLENRIDVSARTLEWLNTRLRPFGGTGPER